MNPVRSRKRVPRILSTSVAALLGLAAAALGDSAIWSGPGTNWTDPANWGGTPFPNSSTDVATFDATGTSFTPTITATTITVGEVSFSAGAPVYTVTLDGTTGSTSLNFAAAGVTNNSSVTQAFSATGNTGSGFAATFTFSNSATAGTNTSWAVNSGGVMQFNDSSSAGAANVTIQSGGKVFFAGSANGGTAVIVNNTGGVFDISAQSGGVSVGSISGDGNFFLGSNTLTTGSDGTSTTVTGVIQDGGVAGGTGGGLTKTGTGTLTLMGVNTYTGATTISDGTIALSGGGTLSAATAVNLTGSTAIFDVSGIAGPSETVGSLAGVSGSSVVLGDRNLTVGGNNADTSFAGIISGTNGTLTKNGSGALTLAGANTYTGNTTLNNGTIFLDNNNALGSGGTLVITSAGGPTTLGTHVDSTTIANPISLQSDVSFTVANGANNLIFTGPIDLNGATRTLNGLVASAQIQFNAPVGFSNGGLTFATPFVATGSYVAFILGPNQVNTYTGLTTIGNGAFLVLEGNTANAAVQGDVLIQGNGVLDYLGGASEQVADNATVTVNSMGNTANGIAFGGLDLFNAHGTETIGTLLGNGSVVVANNTLAVGAGNFTGVISDGTHTDNSNNPLVGGGLTKYGPGVLTLTGKNTYTGLTTVTGGTLNLNTTGGNAISGNVLVAGGDLVLQQSNQILDSRTVTVSAGTMNISTFNETVGGVILSGGSILGTTGVLTSTSAFDVRAGSITAKLAGTAGLTKTTAGTVTLTAANTYTGATTVNGGLLDINTATNPTVLNSASNLVVGGGTFRLTGAAGAARTQILNGLTVAPGMSVVDVNNIGTTTTLDLRGTSGTMGIIHIAGGTVDFRASAGTFGGNAIVLTAQQNDASGIIGTWATVNGGTGFASVNGAGVIVAFDNYFDIAARGPSSVIPNSPNAMVRINSPGTSGPVTLAAPTTTINTLTQNTATASTVDTGGGTLRLGVAGGIFINAGGADLTIGTAPNSGTVTAGGNSNNTAGDLTLGNFSGSMLTINSAITNNGTGVVSLTKTGPGSLTLAGTNTYTGPTTIGGGTVFLTGAGALSDSTAVNLSGSTAALNISGITAAGETVGSLAGVSGSSVALGTKNLTVGGDGTSTVFAGTIAGSGNLTKTGAGAMTLSGASTYSGNTTLSGGTLFLDNNNALGNGAGTLIISTDGVVVSSHVADTSISNKISVNANFSIGTNVDAANPGNQNFHLTGAIDLNGATRTITGATSAGQVHLAGVISNGGVTFLGASPYTAFLYDQTAANTYTGLTTVGTNAFLVLNSTATNKAIIGDVLVTGNGSLDYFQSNQVADGSTITVNSTGLDASGQHFQGLELQNSSEEIDRLLGTGTVGLGSGTLTLHQGDFSGVIKDGDTGSGGNLLKTTSGTLTLSGANTLTGSTGISAGKIALTGAGSLVKSSVSVGPTGVLDITGITGTSTTVGSLGASTGTASVLLGSKILVTGGNNGSTTFAGVLSGAGGGLTKIGTGTMTLTGVNTYTGPTTVNGGTLVVDLTTNPSVLNSSSALVVGGGIFQLTGVSGSAKTQVLDGLTVNAGASSIVINNPSPDAPGTVTTLDLRGPSGTRGITHNAGGSVDFRSNPGGDFGTKAIVLTGQQNDASGILGAWATVNNGAALAANDGTGKIVAFADANYFDIAARGPVNNVIPNDPTKNVRINSPGTTGPVVLAATTTIVNTLTQNNAQASIVDLANKTLKFNDGGGILITPTGGDLTIGTAPNSGTVTSGGVTANQGGEIVLGNFSGSKTLTINSSITNNGVGVVSLTKTGSGLVVLAGKNSYRGATVIGAGTLQLKGVGSVSNTGAVSLTGTTSIFDISAITAANTTIGSLDGVSGSIVRLGSKNLTTGGNNADTVFAGILTDGGIAGGTGGSLTKVGSGTMTLTGVNTFTGLTTVDGGTLILNTTGGNAIAGNVLVDSGTLLLQQTSQIADTATVTVSGGTFDIGANSELVKGVTLVSGSILGTTGVLFSSTTFNVQSGTITANLNGDSNSVGLDKTTSGTVILAGTNSYAGPTNVKGGTLILDGTINGGNGVVVSGGSEFDVTENGIVVVSDGVTVVKATDGNTINNAGLLQGGNNSIGIQAANNNQITNSGAIVGGAVGFKGVVLTGTGNFFNNSGFDGGDKALVLTNPSGNNGAVNYGTLTGVSGTAIDALASGGDLAFTNVGEVNGDIRFGVGNDIMTLATGHPVNGIIDGGAGTNQLRLVGSGTDTLDIGSGYVTNFTTLFKGGGGSWTLTGEGAFPGGTTVNAGNLYVQGNLISDVLVQQMGLLGGTGTITGNLTNFGTVSPGNSPGTITVKGDYKQGKSGNLVIQVGSKKAGDFDVLKVSGKADLAGTLTLQKVRSTPKFRLGDKITFLTAEGGVDGKFSTVENPFNSNTIIQTKVVYASDSVSLEATQGSYEEFARLHGFTPNQRATAKAVDGVALSGKRDKMVDYLNSQPVGKIPQDLDRIAPEELAAVYRIGIGLANVQSQNIQRRTDDLRLTNRRVSTEGFQTTGATPGYSGQLGATGDTGADGQDGKPAKKPDPRWGAFLNGMGEWIRIGNTENARGYDLSTGGVTVGVDYKVSDNFTAGVSAGYAGTGAALASGGKLRVNSGKLGAYATYYDSGFYADAAVSGGYNNYDTQRSGLQGAARGTTDGGEINALLGGGYDWSLESLTLGALTSVEYTYMGLDGFTERGSLAPLNVPGQHGQSLRTKLGFKAVYDWQLGGVLLKPEFRAAWQHEFGDRSFALDSQLATGDSGLFTVHDSVIGRDSLLLGVGASMLWGPRTAAYLFYDGELYRKESESHNVTGGVRISF